jgi:hypothetical protein
MAALHIALLVISSSAKGDCNPGPSLILAGTSLPGLLEADGHGVVNLDINRA